MSRTSKQHDGFTFCEPTSATPTSRVHIRLLEGAPKPSGGIVGDVLCGRDLTGGWDVPGEVSADAVRRTLDAETGPTCPACAAEWARRNHVEL